LGKFLCVADCILIWAGRVAIQAKRTLFARGLCFSDVCSSAVSRRLRCASSSRGTHSCTEPGAIPKKLRRSALVKRPLPSAMFADIDKAARLS
jgi:hypothetical protein